MKNRDAISFKTEKLQILNFNYNCRWAFDKFTKIQSNHK
jgi:hypothetical protein